MTPLNDRSLSGLSAAIGRPGYDRARLAAGIVHLSVGNFHRAHQAYYLDRLFEQPGAV